MNRSNSIVAILPSHKATLCHERGLRRGLMLSVRSAAELVVLLWMTCATMPLHASDLQPLTIAIVESRGGTYFVPEGKRIVIRSQPMHLFIQIRNTSESAVEIRARPEMAYSLELKDQAGMTGGADREIHVNAGGTDVKVR